MIIKWQKHLVSVQKLQTSIQDFMMNDNPEFCDLLNKKHCQTMYFINLHGNYNFGQYLLKLLLWLTINKNFPLNWYYFQDRLLLPFWQEDFAVNTFTNFPTCQPIAETITITWIYQSLHKLAQIRPAVQLLPNFLLTSSTAIHQGLKTENDIMYNSKTQQYN